MKLILTGATGFVGTEVLKQALNHPSITSIISLGRRPTPFPQGEISIDAAKLKSVVCEDFTNYSDNVKKDCEGADACIWLLAITPSKSKLVSAPQLREVSFDYPSHFLETIPLLAPTQRLFRFIYTSGAAAERDPTKKPWILGDYSVLRGEVENLVLRVAQESKGKITTTITKPGLIDQPGRFGFFVETGRIALCTVVGLPRVEVREIAATLIERAISSGDGDETLLNEDLVRIGREVLAKQRE